MRRLFMIILSILVMQVHGQETYSKMIKSEYNYLSASFYDGPNCLEYGYDKLYYSTNLHENSYDSTNVYGYGDVSNASGVPDPVQIIKTDLEGHSCEEIIRINQTSNLNYTLGDEWIYEEEIFFGGGNTNIGYKSFTIQDILFDGAYTKYALDVPDTFYVENSKMYFWDEYYQEYIMYFDWQETESYDIKYYDQFMDSEEIATVVIDSITYKHFGDDSLKVQHVHILNSGTLPDYNDVVYEGVGAGFFGIKFLLGCGLCDDIPQTTKLRCFTNDNLTYQFVPYLCDSTWIITNTTNVDAESIVIYPNPTSDRVYIDGINSDIEYELYYSNGQLIKKGTSYNKMINLENSGFFLIKLKVDESWILKKIVKVE